MQKLVAFATVREMPIQPGDRATFSITWPGPNGPSIPMSVHVASELCEHFLVRGVSVGCRSILLERKSCRPIELENGDNIVPELLHVGMDFSIEVQNVSMCAQAFRFEVWGLRKFPEASWERAALDMTPLAPVVLALVRCSTCGFVLELETGSRIPLWCPSCVEDPEGFDCDEGEDDAHDVPTSDAG